MPSIEDYEREYQEERGLEYPALDLFERGAGFKLERHKLERAAWPLACPVKANPPCWQHGRLLYATARRYLEQWEREQEGKRGAEHRCFLDIGTAKGFSALVLQWAVLDSVYEPAAFPVVSVDVIDPAARVQRNTVAECSGLLTLAETLAPWAEAEHITFVQARGQDWLRRHSGRVCLAFIDGKHNQVEVGAELTLLANHQRSGDIVVLDDLQIGGVHAALVGFRHAYEWQVVTAVPSVETAARAPRARSARIYAVARRR